MSAKSEKRKRQRGDVIDIAAKRAEREFERRVRAAMDQELEDRALSRKRARVVLAVVALALVGALCLALLVG